MTDAGSHTPGPETSAIAALPGSCSVAFKEWAGVCQALATGRQSLILRKGGIAEGPGGFVPEHAVFWLYPTHVHQAEQGLRALEVMESTSAEEGVVAIDALAQVELIGLVDREELLPALSPLHVWTEATVQKRFAYRRPGLWVLGVRVFRRPESYRVPVTPAHAGCKTWVPLESSLETTGLAPVLAENVFRERMAALRAILDRPAGEAAP